MQHQDFSLCGHVVHLNGKTTPNVQFMIELAKYSTTPTESLKQLAQALTDARSALQLSKVNAESPETSSFKSTADIQLYIDQLNSYVALLKGFIEPKDELDKKAPLEDNMTTMPGLQQPLMDVLSPGTTNGTYNYSHCVSFTKWTDVLTNTTLVTPNATIETAQTLLASGLYLLCHARLHLDNLLSSRVEEVNDQILQVAFQLLLRATGVLEACLITIKFLPRTVGASHTDLSVQDSCNTSKDSVSETNDETMEKWRQEQRLVASDTIKRDSDDIKDLSVLHRVPDLAGGHFPQLLAWMSMAQAQEVVLLRGLSRDFVDYTLMARLSVDISMRYHQCHILASHSLPCNNSKVADKLRLYAVFKDHYYSAISSYFQGKTHMNKEEAAHCALAIADFKKAMTLLKSAHAHKEAYEKTMTREERIIWSTVYRRNEEIIERDLDIMVRRNDTVYYERIPEADARVEPLSLVQSVRLESTGVHEIWKEPGVVKCLDASSTKSTLVINGEAEGEKKNKEKAGCCHKCIIS